MRWNPCLPPWYRLPNLVLDLVRMKKPNRCVQRILVNASLAALSLLFNPFSAGAAIQTVGAVTNITLSVDGTNGTTTATFWIDNGGAAAVTPVAADVVRSEEHTS